MTFGSWGVGQGTGVLDGMVIVKEEGAVLEVNLGHPIVTSDVLISNCFGEDLFLFLLLEIMIFLNLVVYNWTVVPPTPKLATHTTVLRLCGICPGKPG